MAEPINILTLAEGDMQNSTIALIVDDSSIRQTTSALLSEAGHTVIEQESRILGAPGATGALDVACLEIADAGGLDKLAKLTAGDPELPVIVLTDQDTVAEQAVQKGAHACMRRTVQPMVLLSAITRAVERRRLAGEVSRLRSQLAHYEGEEVIPLRDLERRAIERALRATNGSVTKAAKLLGIGRATLYRRLSSPEMADLRAIRGTTVEPGSMSSMSHVTLAHEPR
jgi:DNA-binding NtrC family response regulator